MKIRFMSGIQKIYSNALGISFFWKKHNNYPSARVQLVFRDIGFLLTLDELKTFSNACASSKESYHCDGCPDPANCRTLLLRTPSENVDIAVSIDELLQIEELINTTIFKMELKQWVTHLNLN